MAAPTTAPVKLIPKKFSLRGQMKTEEVEDLFETVWKNKGTLTSSLNALITRIAAGDMGARGSEGDIQFNRGGLMWAEPNLNWERVAKHLTLSGVTAGQISFSPLNANYQDMIFGGHYTPANDYIPQSTNLSYAWNQPSAVRFGWELIHSETPDVAASFAAGVGWIMGGPGGTTPGFFDLYQYGGLGTGAINGMGVRIQNNDSGNGAAAWLGLANKDDTYYYMFPDANGVFRLHTARPTEDNTTVSDTVAPGASLQALTLRAGANIASATEALQISANSPAATAITAILRSAGTAGATTGGNIQSQGSRGTVTSPSALSAAGDYLGGWFGMGYHSGGAYSTANVAAIRMLTAEAFTSSAHGTEIDFATTAIGGTSRSVKAIITSAGLLVLGATKSALLPALKPNVAVLEAKVGDDSAYAFVRAAGFGAGTNANSTDIFNVVSATGAPRYKVYNTSTTQFTTAGFTMGNAETTSGHEEWHFYAEKASAGAATGGSNFIIRRRNATQTEATSHMVIDTSGNVYFNAGFTAGSGSSLQGNVGIKVSGPTTALQLNAAGGFSWDARSRIYSPSDGLITLLNAAETGFTRLNLGGTTASFPAFGRSGTGVQARLADNSNYTFIEASYFQANSGDAFLWASRSQIRSSADGVITLFNAANTDFSRLTFGGTSSSFPALKRSTTTLQARLADDSAFAAFAALSYSANGSAGVTGSGSFVTTVGGIVTAIAGATEQTTTSTGTQNNFSLSAKNTILRVNNASAVEFTGFTIGGNAPAGGDTVTILNVGSSTVRVTSQDAGSTAANRAKFPSTRGQILGVDGSLQLVYDDTSDLWKVVSVTPGKPITPTFSAGDYVPDTGTWTVASGDVVAHKYVQDGKQVTYWLDLDGTTIATSPVVLKITLANSFAATARVFQVGLSFSPLGSLAMQVAIQGGGTQIECSHLTGAVWSNSTDGTYVRATITFEAN